MKSFKQFFYEETNNLITIHRGESVHNRKGGPMGGKFYSLDKEFAKQFTQSGRDEEVISKQIPSHLVKDMSHIYAGDDIEPHIEQAKKEGFAAVRFNEGGKEPHSIYVFNHRSLKNVST
jgi:hypothetical protein